MKNELFFGLICIAFFLSGCAVSTTGKVVQEETVKLGAVLSFTGAAASYGESARQGIDLAVEELNSKGGVDGRKLVVIYEDDATDATQAVTAFNKLVHVNKVSAVIGGTWDFNYNAIAPLAEENKITLITPENVMLEGLIVNNYTFVMRPELRKMTLSLKEEFEKTSIKRAAIVRYTSVFSDELVKGLNIIMQQTGGELVLDETYTEMGGNDFRTTVLKLKKIGVDAVFIDMLDTDMMNFIKRVRENSLDVKIFCYSIIDDALANPEIDHQLFNGIVYFDWDTPTSDEFKARFTARYNKEPARSADGAYDSVMMLAEAISKVNDKSRINEYLRTHSFKTINGELVFRNNVITTKTVFIKKVVDGKAKIITTKEIST